MMTAFVGARVTKIVNTTRKVLDAARRAEVKVLAKQAAFIRGIAMRSIGTSKDPAPAGHQPHTKRGQLRKAIRFDVDRSAAFAYIGPTASAIGRIGHTHEFGGVEGPKPAKKGRKALVIRIGGSGPLRVDGFKLIFGKIRTPGQADRAAYLLSEHYVPKGANIMRTNGANTTRRYPKRPFMRPALLIYLRDAAKAYRNTIKS